MKVLIIVNKGFVFFLMFFLIQGLELWGQKSVNVKITDVSGVVADDSLRVGFTLRVSNLKVGSQESLTIRPRITNGDITVPLPLVVYSGGLRRKYDERKLLFSQKSQPPVFRTYTNVSRSREYTLFYESAIPYSSRLQAGKLVVGYGYDDCCNTYPVGEEIYALGTALPEREIEMPVAKQEPKIEMPVAKHEREKVVQVSTERKPSVIHDTIYVHRIIVEEIQSSPAPSKATSQPQTRSQSQPVYQPQPVFQSQPVPQSQTQFQPQSLSPAPAVRKMTFYLEYPVNVSRIILEYGNNFKELYTMKSILDNFRGSIIVKAYSSPEGRYDDNEYLALSRAAGFKDYLIEHHHLPSSNITTEHVAEDWDGLRELIENSNLSHKWEALQIIDNTGIWSGREKKLMDLRGGTFWHQITPFFKQLRRIEIFMNYEL